MIYGKDTKFIYITSQLSKKSQQNTWLLSWKEHDPPLIHYGCHSQTLLVLKTESQINILYGPDFKILKDPKQNLK